MSRYKPPELNGNKVAFRGRRFWVIEIAEGRWFDIVDKDVAEYAVYDAADGLTIACASRKEGGGFACQTWGGLCELDYDVDTIEEIGRVSDRKFRWMLKNCT